MDDDDRATPDMLPIQHVPITPPRKGVDGERAFIELWQRFVARCDEEELEQIFSNTLTAHFTQRQATVAATFVMWLGTNCGYAMRHTADREATEGGYRGSPTDRYLRRWELENRRSRSTNGGIRYCEAILSPQRGAQVTATNAPTVTVDDLDVIECICTWLATPDGQAFQTAADTRVQAMQRERYLFGDDGEPRVIGGTNRTTSGAIGQP